MDDQHPNKHNPRQKRHKDKDNTMRFLPLKLAQTPHITVSALRMVFLPNTVKKLKYLFDQIELNDLTILNEVYRHYALSGQNEETLVVNALHKSCLVEDMIMQDSCMKSFMRSLRSARSLENAVDAVLFQLFYIRADCQR